MHMTTTTRQIGGVTIVDIGGRIVLGEEGGVLRALARLPQKRWDERTIIR
jgi:hypothetical protein